MLGFLGFVERILDLETGDLSSHPGSVTCELFDISLITEPLWALTPHLLKTEVGPIIST